MISNRFNLLALAIMSLASVSVCSADYLTTPTPIVAGSFIAGYCSSTGIVASPDGVGLLDTNLNLGITEAAGIIKDGVMMETKSEQNVMNQSLQSITDFMRRLDASEIAQDYVDQTSNAATGRSPCEDQSQAGSTASGLAAANQFANTAAAAPNTFAGGAPAGSTLTDPVIGNRIAPVANTAAQQSALITTSLTQWDGQTITNPAATDDDVKGAIAHTIAPFPIKGVPASSVSAASAVEYKADLAESNARTSLGIDALTEVAKGYRQTIDISSIKSFIQDLAVWQTHIQNGGSPTKLSPDEYFTATVQRNYNNAQFSADVQSQSDTWQLREQAKMMAANLWANQRENELLERAVALSAADLAHAAQPLVGKANAAKVVTVDQSARGMK